jgi:hypothetical protein
MYPIVQKLRNNNAIFKITPPIHTIRIVQSWFQAHVDALEHLPWPVQSPDLNIFQQLWTVLESIMRSELPPSSSLQQLEEFLQEE